MPNPYDVLGARFGDSDEMIRQRYLEGVRRFSPERDPQQFQRIREAYELIKDEQCRLRFLLFEPTQGESIEELIAEERCRKSLKRVGLKKLLSLLNHGR